MILVDFLSLTLQATMEQYCITCDIELASEIDYVSCVVLDPLTVTINGEDYNFFIENKNKSSKVSGTSYSVQCVSPAVKLDAPYQDTISTSYTSTSASVIIDAMAAYGSITVDYQTVDWTISNLLIQDETPLEVIRKITEAIGAVIQSKPNGDLLIISKYPTSPQNWPTATPIDIFTFADDIIDYKETIEIRDGYNAFIISDNAIGDDSVTLEEEDIDTNRKYIKAFQVPFDEANPFDLLTSGGTVVSIVKDPTTPYTEQIPAVVDPATDPEWEIVEFIDGVGKVSSPMYSLVDYDWIEDDLGTISFEEDGTLSASSGTGESLLRIKYETKYWRWEVTGPYDKNVQFYVAPIL